jgi:acyl-CoA reductase-like NAD-dependent aldehyde dehydrogenase
MSTVSVTQAANYISGKFLQEGTGKTLTVYHKYTGAPMAEVPMASAEQMELALQAATDAFHIYKGYSAGKRSEILQTIRQRLMDQRERFINLIVAEAGKPRGYAATEIDRCLATLEQGVREATRFDGEMVPMDFANGQGKIAFTRRFPIGPIACISPFNFPLNLALHKIAPALAAGCTLVLKPAPQSPLTALAFAELCHDSGLPEGAVNILMCDINEAQMMVTDERMKMLSFTGSPQIGWHLKNIAGKKKIALELGGNAAVIVDDSTQHIHAAAKMTAIGCFLYAGQICISTQRVYVHESRYDEFVSILLEETAKLVVGDPDRDDCTVGPVIDNHHLHRISGWVNEAVAAGAHVLCGGKILDEAKNLYAPTLLTNTNNSMKVAYEEVFGPVAIVEKVSSFKDAIDRTNDSKFGLQAGVYTNNLEHMKYAHEHLEVGGVIMNSIPGYRIDNMPYGGVKDSGLGREGVRYAMEEMTEPRLLVY